jgi:hypothetical protein
MSAAPSRSERFQALIIVGWTPKRYTSSAVVSSFFKAASATLALNSELYLFRLLLMVKPFHFRIDSELNTLSNFLGPPPITDNKAKLRYQENANENNL